MGFFIT